MKNNVAALLVGFIFALGLGISGMTDPHRVIGFLNIFGAWDPSLAFVMIGAIGVHFVSYRLIRRRSKPLLADKWHVPTKTNITPSLIIGAVIFGVGWGLAGFCPGPALTGLVTLQKQPLIFVGGMVVGMLIFKILDRGFKIPR